MTMTTHQRLRLEGYLFLVAFGFCIPAANWMIGNVGTTCVPNGPCLVPVAPGLAAPSGVLMIGLALVLRDLVDADSKMIVSYFIGGRDGECAMWFVGDLRRRLANRVQLTSDGHKAYLEAVEGAFGQDIDYAILHKAYGPSFDGGKGKYSPAECIGTQKARIEGDPDLAHVSTSYVERSNLTMRMHMRRFTRLTNGFSNKVENHAYAVALHMMYYNFVRLHSKLRTSPAMAAGVSSRLWEIGDIVALVEAEESKADRTRGSYKKKL